MGSSATPTDNTVHLRLGELVLDRDQRKVSAAGEPVQLAPKEFDLLQALLEHRGDVLSRSELLTSVWGYQVAVDTRTIDVHVRQLRRKLGTHCPIETVWGRGYMIA
jgi:two-component system alkaline phosphatase synthesis response regulator PhoP